MKKINLNKTLETMNAWTLRNQFKLTIFNLILITLFVLRSAGYFHPFFLITINFIVFVSLILSIILLDTRSKALFTVSLAFWLFAAVLRILKVNVWAERTAVYAFQAFFIAFLVMFIEMLLSKKKNN